MTDSPGPKFTKGNVTNVVVTGKSGAGKQPRIDALMEEYGLDQLSTGNIFRHYLGLFKSIDYPHSLDPFFTEETKSFVADSEIQQKLEAYLTEAGKSAENIDDLVLGLKAKYFVEKGLFGPDDLVNQLVRSAFGKTGFKGMVLDGYPRTLSQAEYLFGLLEESNSKIDVLVIVDNDDEKIVKRTVGRRICPDCGKVYHVEFKPPAEDGSCKECGTKVILRSDDSEEKIRRRLAEFQDKCIPAIEYLKKAGIPVASVPGNLEVFTKENVRKSVMDALDSIQ
jgi:adenylate kinase